MADAQPNPPTKPNPTDQPKPAKKAVPGGAATTSAEVAGNLPNFNLGELVDLALCAPEVGAVNFNILRLLLRQMLDKTGIEKQSVKMTDLEAHQVDNFRNYVQGAVIASPMPGVLKISPQGLGGGPGKVYGVKPGTTGQDNNKALVGASSKTPRTSKLPPTETVSSGDIPEKVARLEKHMEALYQLPGNAEILERANMNAMSVNDMWQIIQLNNRIAAAEAAIQKMASLIEDLARSMNRVKGDTKTIKKDTADLTLTHSDLQLQGQSLSDKCEEFGTVVKSLRGDMDKIKKGWKKDRDLLEKSLGVDLGRVPSFMKTKQDRDAGTTGTSPDDESAEQFERGTQTFVHLEDKEKPNLLGPTNQQKAQPPRSPPKPQGQKKGSPQQDYRDAETSGQQPSKTPQSSKGQAEQQQQQPPTAKNVENMIPPKTIANMSPEDIAKQVTIEEVLTIPPEVFKQMTPEQKKVLRDIHKSAPQQKPKPKPPLGVKNLTVEELENLDPGKIMDHMSYEEAAKLAPEILDKMSDKQKEAVQKVIKNGEKAKQPPSGKKKSQEVRRIQTLGVASMNAEELAATSPSTILNRMHYDETVKIPPEVLDKMTNEQRDAVRKVIDAGRPPSEAELEVETEEDAGADDDDDDFLHYLEERQHEGALEPNRKSKKSGTKTLTSEELGDIAKVLPQDLAASISPEMARAIPPDELQRRFTPEQIQEIERLKSIAPQHVPRVPEDVFPEHVADMTPSELVENLTDNQLLEMTTDQLSVLSPDQQVAVKEAIRKSRIAHAAEVHDEDGEEGVHTDVEEEEEMHDDKSESDHGGYGKSKKDRQNKQPVQKQHRHHKHHKHHHDSHEGGHPHVDIVQGPIPGLGQPLPPMTLEEYMSALPPDEAANLAADAVQRELQKQYAQLQGMQRQLAQDIQDKMEFMYKKLLTEIAIQQASTSPYMAVGDADQCLGPGICTGHGMPAGIAVVQFPDAKKDEALVPAGYAVLGAEDITGKVCPGPGICPGNAACSYCQCQSQPLAQGSAEVQIGLQGLRAPEKKGGESVGLRGVAQGVPLTEMDEALLREMKSLMMLDLEKIREEMRFKKFGVFDEQDVSERLGAVWEALKILKHNEEALAIKIARQDTLLKKLPIRIIEKLSKIPDENLDAMATGQFQKHMYLPDDSPLKRQTQQDIEDLPRMSPMKSIATAVDKEDIQTLFNNLASVIGECAEQKDKIDQIADTTRIMEAGMVTKQMLLDALADKADKGLINTKVSYDEFGNTVDELHNQLHNLMMEGYQRNENWKKTTADLAGELTEKLDKVEIAPIRAFFKSHLKALEEKVNALSKIVEEPDPAGTRKRLLRDYNCLSCDRMVNITGVTNGPTLPKIGPISAGHSTASQRALELHRMRMRKQFDPDTKNLNALGRQTKALKSAKNIHVDPKQIACDIDVMHVVNRYTGGSHTAVTTGERLASQRRPSTVANPMTNPPPIVSGGTVPNTARPIAASGGET